MMLRSDAPTPTDVGGKFLHVFLLQQTTMMLQQEFQLIIDVATIVLRCYNGLICEVVVIYFCDA